MDIFPASFLSPTGRGELETSDYTVFKYIMIVNSSLHEHVVKPIINIHTAHRHDTQLQEVLIPNFIFWYNENHDLPNIVSDVSSQDPVYKLHLHNLAVFYHFITHSLFYLASQKVK